MPKSETFGYFKNNTAATWSITLLIAEILSGKNVRTWVSMDFK